MPGSIPTSTNGRPPRVDWHLRTYFLALALGFVAVAATGVAYVSNQATRDGRQTAKADARFVAQSAAKQVADGVQLLQSTVQQLAQTPGIKRALTTPEECSLSFGGPAGIESGHIDVISDAGTVVCSSRQPAAGAEPTTYRGAAWLTRASTRLTVDAPVDDPATGDHAIVIAAPFDGGLVAGFLTLEPVGTELAKLYGGGRPVEVMILSGQQVLARSTDPQRWVSATLPASSALGDPTLQTADDLDGQRRIYGTTTVSGTSWRLLAGSDERAALASARTLRDRQLIIIGIGLALTLLATLVVYRRVARPIARLDDAVRAAATEPELRHVEVEGPAEIARLATSVNGFVDGINAQLAARSRADASAQRSERNYRELFERSPLPTWIYEPSSGEILQVNDAALRVYGYSREAFLAQRFDDVQTGPAEHRRHDGSRLAVRITSHRVTFDERPARLVIAEDVGERERLEQRIQQGQRMESIGRLAGGIAHDFNNLLAAVVGYSDLLLRATPKDDPHRDEMQQIKDAGERAVGLTKQLLAFARGQAVATEAVDVNATISGLEPMLRQLLPPSVSIDVALADDAGAVEIDRSQLEQIVVNLAVNAGHAMPDGGRLAVATRSVTMTASALPGGETGGDPVRCAVIEVTDTGVGMDRATLEHIFEPFFTTRDQGEGTGLGLATVYRVVEGSGGTIEATSEPGAGTTFSIALPATQTSAAGSSGEPAKEAATEPGARVLLVDDDEAVRGLVRRMLELQGFQLLEAADGDQALQLSGSQPADSLDLVITDSVIPGPGGVELAKRIRERHKDVQILVMSGYSEDQALGETPLASEAGFIAKPFTSAQLEAVLAELSRRDR